MPHDPGDPAYLPGMRHPALLPLYDPLTRLLGVGSLHRRLLEQAGIQPGHRVLEIGCGTGNLLLLTAQVQPRATLTGLDPDLQALDRARRKARRAGIEVRLDEGFAGALPYADATFDHVLSALMFHHLPRDEKQRALREVRRVLVPGGALHLLDFDVSTPASAERRRRPWHRHHHHGELLADNTGPRMHALITEAGLTEPERKCGGRAVLGRYACYQTHA